MDLFTVDFETYYDDEYSLTKMSTEDYVNDPRFEIILVGIKKNNEKPKWFSGTLRETFKWLYQEGAFAPTASWLAHNMLFDGLVAAVHLKFVSKLLVDTLAMAQFALKPHSRSISLDSCTKNLDLGIRKGTEVHNMKGRTRASLSPAELQCYAEYCMTDCEAEYRLFRYLKNQFPADEFLVMDMTLRMYLQPKLKLDAALLAEILAEIHAKKAQMLASLPANVTTQMLGSNDQFAELLKTYGIEPPMKVSPTTGLATYAFAKTDSGFKELEEEVADHPELSVIMASRLGVKSTIEESRTERLLQIAKTRQWLRVPLRYYAAHTGRYGGMEKINMQNPPRVDKSRLRFCIVAPPGKVVLGLDLAQIEARLNAWWSGQEDLLDVFRRRGDPYATFASTAYRCDVVKGRSKLDDKRRFVGKTCILGLGYGMGAPKLKTTLFKDGVKVDIPESERLVRTYRTAYSRIPARWRVCDQMLGLMAGASARSELGPVGFIHNGIVLPNGMTIAYPHLRMVTADSNKLKYSGWAYTFAGEMRTLWGGKIVENVVQSLARILVTGYMVQIKREYNLDPALQVHDELDYVVDEDRADDWAKALSEIMRVTPSWAEGLPVEVEANYGRTFGDCK